MTNKEIINNRKSIIPELHSIEDVKKLSILETINKDNDIYISHFKEMQKKVEVVLNDFNTKFAEKKLLEEKFI